MNFGHCWSSEEYTNSYNLLARYYFLLVFYSDIMFRWTHFQVIIAVKVSSTIIPTARTLQGIYRATFAMRHIFCDTAIKRRGIFICSVYKSAVARMRLCDISVCTYNRTSEDVDGCESLG